MLLAGAIALVTAACHDAIIVQTAKVAQRPLSVPILADGSLEPPPGGEIRATEGGIIQAILTSEGQRVGRGSPLLRLDSPDLVQRLLAGRAASMQIAEELLTTSAELATRKGEADHLRSIAAGDQRLLPAGAITAQQKTVDDLSYRQAAEQLAEAESHLAALSQRKQTLDASTGELQRRVDLLTIRAPADGIVYNLPRVAGDSIVPGQAVATVADPRHLSVRIRVDAPDLPRIRTGQRILVRFDGLPGRHWDGAVTLVPPGLRQVAGREVAEVLGEISSDTAALPPNASVNVEIVVGEKGNALVIPRGALLHDGDARFVYRYLDHHARRTNVSVGLIGSSEVEIVSGLQPDDQVILTGVVSLRDGQAVESETSP
jgi:RND family efflux transporter MFP subunit